MAHSSLMLQAAASVDAPAELLPALSGLFRGVNAMGSSPGLVVKMLKQAGIGSDSRVIDLGCGKGAVSIAAARKLGCRCVGVDAVPAFVGFAAGRASKFGVEDLCEFRVGDVRDAKGKYDAALMLGLFDVARASRLLKRLVKPGGIMVVDDAVARTARSHRWITLEQARRSLNRHGEIIAERMFSSSAIRKQEATLYAAFERNAARIMREDPTLNPFLRSFLKQQRRAADLLVRPLSPVQWMVRVRT